MAKIVVLWAVFSIASCQNSAGDLDAAIRELFRNMTSTRAPDIKDRNLTSTIVPPPQPSPDTIISCKMKNGETGTCVPHYLCNRNNSVVIDGSFIIDIKVQDNPCPSYLDVCCGIPDTRHPENPITPSPEVQPKRPGCGWRNPEGIGFKTTGDKDGEAKFGEFPWMVAILNDDYLDPKISERPKERTVYLGGGSLIHPSAVLTAAHIRGSSFALKVRAGEWDTQTTKEIYPFQDRDVSDVVAHNEFNKNNLYYDIAILFLNKPVDIAPNVGTVCLPPPSEMAIGGTRCFSSGWGKDTFSNGQYQAILKKVELPVVEKGQCEKSLRATRLGNFFTLHTSFMCAGGESTRDTCTGDGGSPLVCPIQHETERYVQTGIVAWGIGCGEGGSPGVYVDVANLRNWIDDKMAGKGYNTSTYTLNST